MRGARRAPGHRLGDGSMETFCALVVFVIFVQVSVSIGCWLAERTMDNEE
jgi:hypothetical protein